MNHENYVVSYELAGKVYVFPDHNEPLLFSSKSRATSAMLAIFKAVCDGSADPMTMVASVLLDFRIHRASTIPSSTKPAEPPLQGLSGVIVRGPRAKAWHARGEKPFTGSKGPRRIVVKKKEPGYNKGGRPVYGS